MEKMNGLYCNGFWSRAHRGGSYHHICIQTYHLKLNKNDILNTFEHSYFENIAQFPVY